MYHVALYVNMSLQNEEAENLPAAGSATEAPAASELSNAATNPWTWNNGRTMTVESDSVSLYTDLMFSTDEAKLCCVNGTPLGRLVVPEVWRNSATSDSSLTSSEIESVGDSV